uniref:Serpin domain-containing protein n=1 Tax=Romanomermis culicivorax TaxID=13658 RepID=A0A915IPC4_ROMCU
MLRIDEICLNGLNWSDVLQFYTHTLNLLNINLLTIANQMPKESYEVTKCFHFAAKCFFKEPDGSVAFKKSMKNVIHHLAKLEVFGFTNKTESFVQANYNLFGGTRTHNYILEFLRTFNEQTSVALINVFHFSPYWRTPFSRFRTQTDKFTLESGEEINVPFMNGRDLMKYMESNVYQMVGVYMAMGRLIYFIMVPKPGFNLDDVYERFFATDGSMEKMFDLFIGSVESDVTLKMPKLRMHFEHDLIEKMRKFGAGDELFGKDGALFGKNLFSTEGAQEGQPSMSINHFGQVEEKFLTPNNRPFMITYNDVVNTIKYSIKNPSRIVNVVRPFYFFVIDKDTHATYLCGRVTNPFSRE